VSKSKSIKLSPGIESVITGFGFVFQTVADTLTFSFANKLPKLKASIMINVIIFFFIG
jgi:hypothetical protein